MRASRWGHEDSVIALLKAGASYTAKDAVSALELPHCMHRTPMR